MKESIYKSYDELPLFLNAETVAKALGVSPSSGYELMHEQGFPSLKIGNRIVIPKEAQRHTALLHPTDSGGGRLLPRTAAPSIGAGHGAAESTSAVVAAVCNSGAAFSGRTATDTPGNAKRRVGTCVTFDDMPNSKVNRGVEKSAG